MHAGIYPDCVPALHPGGRSSPTRSASRAPWQRTPGRKVERQQVPCSTPSPECGTWPPPTAQPGWRGDPSRVHGHRSLWRQQPRLARAGCPATQARMRAQRRLLGAFGLVLPLKYIQDGSAALSWRHAGASRQTISAFGPIDLLWFVPRGGKIPGKSDSWIFPHAKEPSFVFPKFGWSDTK